jgi:O-antigen/teichoic acid export membrane protein
MLNYRSNNTSANNKRIAKNTMLLYFRMLITMLVGLYTSRIVLQALGVSDYGLYNVVGGVVTMFTFVNGSMAAGTQRFITFELGRGDMNALNKVFSTSVVVHLILIAAIFMIAETVGVWFVQNKMVFDVGRENAAMWVYQFSIIASLLSIFQTPFMATIIAHEKMNIYAYMSIFDAMVKLLIAFVIQVAPFDKLIFYALLFLVSNVVTFAIYIIYCRFKFEESRFTLHLDKPTFRKMFSFSAWDIIGSLATVGQAQGVNVVINIFCGTVVNAARGISVTVNSMVMQFVNNFLMAANPQLIKYYANNQIPEMVRLAINTANLATYLLLFVGIPVFIEIEYLLYLWLGEYPDYAPIFVRIILIQSLIQSIGTPTMRSLHAIGNIKLMNIFVGALLLLILPMSYVLFKLGCSVEIVLLLNILPWLFAIPIRLLLLKKYIGFPFWTYFIEVLVKGSLISLLAYIFPSIVHNTFSDQGVVRLFLVSITGVVCSSVAIYYLGLNKPLRQSLRSKVSTFINKCTS